jgi:carboxyl-terminal processing protease
MKSRKSIPLYFLLVAGGLAIVAFRFTSLPNKYEKIIKNVVMVVREVHYNPKPIDDNLSKVVFTRFIEDLDVNKDILLQTDVDALRAKYGTGLDEELLGKNKPEFFAVAGDLYKKRFEELAPVYKELLSSPFDFSKDENVLLDTKKVKAPANEAERKEYWRKRMKFMTLERLNDLLNQQEADKNKPGAVSKTTAGLEKEAREKVTKVMDRMFEGMRKKATTDEYFRIFVNDFTQEMDPHSDYFPPVEKRNFDEEMSGRYGGIGAGLREEDGNIKIISLTSGSPAWKSGEIAVGDMIVSVTQAVGDPVDVAGLGTSDCVKIIRGKVGTEVKLTLKKADGSIKVVKLVRQELKLEDTFVKSTIIKEGDQKIGMIWLPEFYADFERPGGARCAPDVAKEIEKLKRESVSGIILDLRNNGGGSLYDVVQMAGFFIEDGPVVQVKDREGVVSTQKDRDKSVLWDGPLAVMVNEFSASASEIFAAAIQDYKRGVIIGSSSTFGKGTVQRQIPLNFDDNKMLETDEYGSIKITLQKFYRVSGGSTQLKGVTPDIIIPDTYEYLKFREKDSESALKWDEISRAGFSEWKSNPDFDYVKKNSAGRIQNSASFKLIRENTAWLNGQMDKEYSLNLEKYRAEQKLIKATSKQMEGLMKNTAPLNVSFMKEDETKYLGDKDKADRNNNFLKALGTDIYLAETVKVVQDMIKVQNIALNKK